MTTTNDDRVQRQSYDVFYREFSRALIVFEENLRRWDQLQASARVSAA